VKIEFGPGETQYGKGIDITLTGDEAALAIRAYLLTQGVQVTGATTVTVNGQRVESAKVYVDPSGRVSVDWPLYLGLPREQRGEE
jgi:hypothetical protein